MASPGRTMVLALAVTVAPGLLRSAPAEERWVVKGGRVVFTATGWPGSLRVEGRGAAPEGDVVAANGNVSGRVVFDLETLRTGIELRDRHMREKYLQTSVHRHSELTLQTLLIPLETAGATTFELEKVPFAGLLRLHGVQQAITGTADLTRRDSRVSVVASFSIETRTFGIQAPSFAGITLGERIRVRVSLDAERP